MNSSETPLPTPTNETNPNPVLLSVHVKHALERYFSQLNGYEAANVYEMVMSEVEKPLLEAVLAYCGHNQSKAAKALGLSRSTLRKKLEQYNLC